MAIDNFIPEIWAASLETEFLASQVVIPTVSGKYDGEIRVGNTVHITGAVTPTIVDYGGAGRSITAEALADDGIDLLIDQEKAFSFIVDDIDKRQAAGSMEDYTTSAGRALAEDAESYLLTKMLTESWTQNVTGASPTSVTTYATAKAAVLKIRTFLNNKKIPTGDRYLVVNPAFSEFLVDGLSDVALAGGSDELRNGQIARAWGFTILESPLLGDQSKPTAIGYHTVSAAFAAQIAEVEALRHQTKFADIVRGLDVYGAKVVRQQAIASYVSGGTTQNAFSSFLS
jgi:hypothetical protein